MTRRSAVQAAADRTAALRQAKFRARRRAERGLAAHNRLKDPDVRRLFDPRTDTVLCRLYARLLGRAHVAAGRGWQTCRSDLWRIPPRDRPAPSVLRIPPLRARLRRPARALPVGPSPCSSGKAVRSFAGHLRHSRIPRRRSPRPCGARDTVRG